MTRVRTPRRIVVGLSVGFLVSLIGTALLGSTPCGAQLYSATSKDADNLTGVTAIAASRPEVLDLEPAVAQAELVLAARLVDIAETRIVHGGGSVDVTQQYRLKPEMVLKGVYAREELLMTGQDLGIYRFAEGASRLEPGQLVLITLARQNQGFMNCNGASTLNQSIPRLAGLDDPLLPAVKVLATVVRERDRGRKVGLLLAALKGAQGRVVPPLLLSIGRRGVLAAREPGGFEAILPSLESDSGATREIAALTLATLLDSSPERRVDAEVDLVRSQVADALTRSLGENRQDLGARVAAIRALGSAGAPAVSTSAQGRRWLGNDIGGSQTFAEDAARLRALLRLKTADRAAEVAKTYEALRLDAPESVQLAAASTLAALDAPRASELIANRLDRKRRAGLPIEGEISRFGLIPRDLAAPRLLAAWSPSLTAQAKLAFAQASQAVRDPSLVDALSSLLDPSQYQTRHASVAALIDIDTDTAARILAAHLDEQADLPTKLRIVAFLGRHGIKTGLPTVMDGLFQPPTRSESLKALEALQTPEVVEELKRIWDSSQDPSWDAAAIRGLARLGRREIIPKLLLIAGTTGDPLVPSALMGLGELGEPAALPAIRRSLESRGDETVIAAAEAAGQLLNRPGLADPEILDKLSSLLSDANASYYVRSSALSTLIHLKTPNLEATLLNAARDAKLEGSPLLMQIETAIAHKPPSDDQ